MNREEWLRTEEQGVETECFPFDEAHSNLAIKLLIPS